MCGLYHKQDMFVIVAIKSFLTSIKLQENIFDKHIRQNHSFLSLASVYKSGGMMRYISYDNRSHIHNID